MADNRKRSQPQKNRNGSSRKNTGNNKNEKSKQPYSSKRAEKREKKDQISEEQRAAVRNRAAVIVFCVSLFLLCLCIIPGESVWLFMRQKMLFGTFGLSAFLLPVFLMAIAAFLVKDKNYDKGMTTLTVGTSSLVLLVSSIVHILANTKDTLSYDSIWNQIQDAYAMGLDIHNGGLFGAVIGGTIGRLFGKAGALITLLILTFAIVMIVTNTTLTRLKNMVAAPVRKVGDVTGERIERHREMRRERYERESFDAQELAENDFTPQDMPNDFTPPPEIDSVEEPAFDEELKIIPPPRIYGGQVRQEQKNRHEIKPLKYDLIEDNTAPRREIPAEQAVPDPRPEPKKRKPRAEAAPAVRKEPVSEENEFAVTETAYISKKSGGNELYKFPPLSCLSAPSRSGNMNFTEEQRVNGQKLVDTLRSFGVETKITEISRGPSVTRYEIQPAPGVKISKITGLADDIAMNMASSGVRIEAPIPNKSAVGIEIPNRARSTVTLREIIDTDVYRNAKSKLNVALGKDITGDIICADLAKMPHLLIAGTTGSGKSVCLNSMIVSLLYNATPDEVKFLMIDPKQVEFTVYNGIPHLLIPVVSDPRKSAGALAWAVTEMLNRYKLFAERNVRDIKGYNKFCDANPDIKKLPQIVIFIDELSDLMMAAPNEVEDSICRLAQMARAAGMHLVIATQRPSVDVITGIIKANIPSRISLSVSSQVDSRTIIDTVGAEKLLGNGDMLFSPVGMVKPLRVQGSFLSDHEVERVVEFIKTQKEEHTYDEEILEEIEKHAVNEKKKAGFEVDGENDEADAMLPNAIAVVVEAQMASTTLLQKKLKLGYARASRIVDDLEERGIIGPFEGSKPRKVLISKAQYEEMNALSSDGVLDLKKTPVNEAPETDEDEEDF